MRGFQIWALLGSKISASCWINVKRTGEVDDEYCSETLSFRYSLPWSALRPSNVPGLGLNASLLSSVTQGRTWYAQQFPLSQLWIVNYTSATFIPILLYLCFVPSRWLFYKSTCIVYAFCGVLFGLCSLSNLTALSCVCWLKVCCPNYGRNNTTMCASMLAL